MEKFEKAGSVGKSREELFLEAYDGALGSFIEWLMSQERNVKGRNSIIPEICSIVVPRYQSFREELKWGTEKKKVQATLAAIYAQKPKLKTLVLCIIYMQEAMYIDNFGKDERPLKDEVEAILANCPHLNNIKHFKNCYNQLLLVNNERLVHMPVSRIKEAASLLKDLPKAWKLADADLRKKN
jgi:hypothetical protein